ncbi:zinc transporter ZupT [Desulfoferula mesophila]|uniref:Zinc transporter ZupT n=1 Tax=Desulfoferula mesophila TaxID=3058419 RepID=A0AAU9E8U4_9BACT|nr:zinc transporter ZupT [Desulfoferula mesophilus]
MPFEHLTLAFSLTILAGLATGLGSAAVLLARRTNTQLLALALGFSAGVMVYVSFVEMLAKAKAQLTSALGEGPAAWATAGAFFGGIAFIGLIDRLVPEADNPHEAHRVEEVQKPVSGHRLKRMGLFTALAIAIHNFPEGLATFTAALADPALGLAIAVAIAIHNVPEGVAVAVPIYYATGSRGKAFFYSFLSGLAEPAGALVGYLLLRDLFSPALMGVMFAAVAGIMVFISLDELLPTAEAYGHHHLCIYGLVAGMAVMALSLLLLL